MSATIEVSDLRAAGCDCLDVVGALPVSILSDESLQSVSRWASARAYRAACQRTRESLADAAEAGEIELACNTEIRRRFEARTVNA